jgi:hypothetical protein
MLPSPLGWGAEVRLGSDEAGGGGDLAECCVELGLYLSPVMNDPDKKNAAK